MTRRNLRASPARKARRATSRSPRSSENQSRSSRRKTRYLRLTQELVDCKKQLDKLTHDYKELQARLKRESEDLAEVKKRLQNANELLNAKDIDLIVLKGKLKELQDKYHVSDSQVLTTHTLDSKEDTNTPETSNKGLEKKPSSYSSVRKNGTPN